MIKKGTHRRPTLLIFPKDLGKSDNSTLQDKLHAWQRVRKTTSYCLSPRKPDEGWLACNWQLLLHSCHHLPACLPPGSLRGDPPKRYLVFSRVFFQWPFPFSVPKRKSAFGQNCCSISSNLACLLLQFIALQIFASTEFHQRSKTLSHLSNH